MTQFYSFDGQLVPLEEMTKEQLLVVVTDKNSYQRGFLDGMDAVARLLSAARGDGKPT